MTYLGEAAQIPFLHKSEIAKRAQELLDECWDGVFPVNIEAVCDYLGVSVVPVPGLVDQCHVDAFISSDFKTIYVDEGGYSSESPRYRFSLAHELGHYVLHREYFSSRVSSFEEWQGLSQGVMSGYVEYQANCFAGNLLAPEDDLLMALNDEFDGCFVRYCWDRSYGDYRRALGNVRRIFMVSEQVVMRRMRDTIYGLGDCGVMAERVRRSSR